VGAWTYTSSPGHWRPVALVDTPQLTDLLGDVGSYWRAVDEDGRYLNAPCDCPTIFCEQREYLRDRQELRERLEILDEILELREQLRCPQPVDDVP
jgi:hypothetical protein